MPVYIRKDMVWTPPSLRNATFDDEDNTLDFIQDPDLYRDLLPQPYRMIDKVLSQLVDNTWDRLNSREGDRVADAARFRPPRYECGVQIEDETPNKAECMCCTPNGQFVIVGIPNGLSAIKSETHKTLDTWTEEGLNVASIQTRILSENMYLITTIDDMGLARLFALAGEQIFLLCVVNESDGGSKNIASKCEASSQGDYLLIYFEKPSSQEGWVEVHKLPKENWIKDLESLTSLPSNAAPQANRMPTPIVEGSETGRSAEGSVTNEKAVGEGSEEQRSQSPGSQKGDRSVHRFTSTNMTMKIMPPSKLAGTTYNSVYQASKTVDHTCDVLGTGAHHLLTSHHLDMRRVMFDHTHMDQLKYLESNDDQLPMVGPTFHFLRPNRVIPYGPDGTASKEGPSDPPGSVAVWWGRDRQLMLYALQKPAKDLERKPDAVFPMSSEIVTSCVSSDGSQVALALKNNNLVVWDMYLGAPKGVMHMAEGGAITQVSLLTPSMCPQMELEYPPYPVATSYYAMVVMETGQVYLVNCSNMAEAPVAISLNIEKDSEIPTMCEQVAGVPGLLLTCRKDGSIYLHDLLKGKQLCQVTLPTEYELISPWQPLVCVAAEGRMLYIKGTLRDPPAPAAAPEDDETPVPAVSPTSRLFVFQLRSFPALDRYRGRPVQNIPFVVHSTTASRVDTLIRERLVQQPLRQKRMQQRWSQLSQELEVIQKMREDSKKRAPRATFSAASIIKTPLLFGKHL